MAQRKSARSERRARERAVEKLFKERQKLARLEPGGCPERPMDVESASVVEPRAEAAACLRCNGAVRTLEHRAEVVDERRLRVVRVRCAHCAAERTFYFRLGGALPS